jgi:hypothetical protein
MPFSASVIFADPDFLPTTAGLVCRNPHLGRIPAEKCGKGAAEVFSSD